MLNEKRNESIRNLRERLRSRSEAGFRAIEQGGILIAFPWVVDRLKNNGLPEDTIGYLTVLYVFCFWNFTGHLVSLFPAWFFSEDFDENGEIKWSEVFKLRCFVAFALILFDFEKLWRFLDFLQ